MLDFFLQFKNALELFFHKPEYQPWHTERIEKTAPIPFDNLRIFEVPKGRIYEVYVFFSSADVGASEFICTARDLADLMAKEGSLYPFLVQFDISGPATGVGPNLWFPVVAGLNMCTWNSTGTLVNANFLNSAAPQGWLFSEGEIVYSDIPFYVRWRDVTNIRGKGY